MVPTCNLVINYKSIEFVDQMKILGLVVDSKLKWKAHLNDLHTKSIKTFVNVWLHCLTVKHFKKLLGKIQQYA